jgi:hypothetical protein
MSDTTCSVSSTTETFAKGSVHGVEGYVNCDGPSSYMIINQYLTNCKLWNQGKSGAASTVVAADACTLSGSSGGVGIYSRTTCDGDNQMVKLYAGDNTCTTNAALVSASTTTTDCHYFTSQGALNVYSAVVRCVIDDMPQRCTTPLVDYEAVVTVEGADDDVDYYQVYMDLFPDATVMLTNGTGDSFYLSLGFCSPYEDAKYATSVDALGDTTLSSPDVSDSAKVCWTCSGYTCNNETRCGTDSYCDMTEQCVSSTTSTEGVKSANVVYTSFAVMTGLVLSWTLF